MSVDPSRPQSNIIGEFVTVDGRVTVYRRKNRVTLCCVQKDGVTFALHFHPDSASWAGKLLIEGSETTLFDEDAPPCIPPEEVTGL